MNEAFVKAEIYLTGIALSSKDKANEVFEMVDPDSFSYPEVKELFVKARSHWKKNGSLDYNAFSLFLTEEQKTVAEFCRAYYAPSLEPKEIAQTFIDEVAVERAKELAGRLSNVSKAEDITDFIGELQKITKGVSPVRQMTFAEYMDNFAYIVTEPIRYIETGYDRLDRDVMIDRGDFVILTGEQSAGKTAFSISLAINFAVQGYRVAYFSLETSMEQILARATAIYSGCSFGNILRHDLSEEDMTKVGKAEDFLRGLPITVIESSTATVESVKRTALELRAEIVIIDYVGLLKGKGDSIYELYTGLSLGLHTLAQSEKITVVALAQKNRESNRANDGSMHGVVGSGQFESDADLMLNLVRKGDRKGQDRWQTELNISKNKKGKVDTIDMWFDGVTQRFIEMTEAEKRQLNKPKTVVHDVLAVGGSK
jgi:replicative DNA helicase